MKIDIKKEGSKSTAVEYEVYNPYNKKPIDLSICGSKTVSIYAPISLNQKETCLYNDLNEQGYDLFDVNNSFYLDSCTQYTSQNGTDVQLSDRRDYFYDENIVLCEDNCKYIRVNTQIEKVYCNCSIKSNVNVNGDQEFSPQKLLENFVNINAISNFEVLFCYKLLFSSKGLNRNIFFYILLVLFALFFISMIINLFIALKKIEKIIIKIFQEKFMSFSIKNGRHKRNIKINEDIININDNNTDKKDKAKNSKFNLLERIKLKSKSRKSNKPISIFKRNIYKVDEHNNNHKIKNTIKKILTKKKMKSICKGNNNNIDEEEDISYSGNNNKEDKIYNDGQKLHLNNNKNHKISKIYKNQKRKSEKIGKQNVYLGKKVSSVSINIINNIMSNHQNPPIKKNSLLLKGMPLIEKNYIKEKELIESSKISKIKKKSKNLKKKNVDMNESSKTHSSHNQTYAKLKKNKKNKLKNSIFNLNESKQPISKEMTYIDEELNLMDYQIAFLHDKRKYWQYYWSLLKKKHIIILTFVSNEDYNVFLLKFSLFILSLALYFSVNTFFYDDGSLHTIFSQQGRYNLIYQIPQVLYSTLISSIMNFILKKLSLSQNELIRLKKEQSQNKFRQMADQSKKCLKLKLYSFFFFGLLLLLFFWYYISVFAAVYPNTQLHLIKDTLISFGISIAYPFYINLIPGIFRIQSFKSNNRECLFKIGQIIALF